MPETLSTVPATSGQVAQAQPSTDGDSQATRIGSEPETSSAINGDSSSPEAGKEPARKRESQFQRIKRQKEAFQKREAELRAREERLAQAEQAGRAPKKPEYTAAELKQYRQAWENEGRFDLVEEADKEIARLEELEKQEKGQESFVKEWRTAEQELFEADPEFMRPGTRLDSRLRDIMAGPDGDIYRGHQRGIVAAYHRAKMEILEGDYKVAQGKIRQLETELKRLTGLTSIGGGAPGRLGTARIESLGDFSKLSSADMRKHLKSKRGSGGMPWL